MRPLRLPLAGLLLLCLLVVPGLARAQTPEATPAGATPAATERFLVDAAWLQAHLGDGNVRVVSLQAADAFAKGHIPGAAQIDWPDLTVTDTSDPSIAKWEGQVEQILTRLGITRESTVIVYDDGNHYAPRLWWILTQLSHPDVRLLDGGLPGWQQVGGKVETGPSTVKPAATPYQGTPDPSALATLDQVKGDLGKPGVVLVDARPPDQYAAGHIPGAVNIPYTANYTMKPGSFLLPPDQLRGLYEQVGVTPDKQVIVYCNTGVLSSSDYLALRILGYPNVRLYTGSFKEWSSHPELPVAK